VSFIAEEVREPGRTLPRALIGGSVLIIALYLFVNAGYFYALRPEAVANVPEASSVAALLMIRMLGRVRLTPCLSIPAKAGFAA
jgi:basic amino acid/polyamine antiporter, APA family